VARLSGDLAPGGRFDSIVYFVLLCGLLAWWKRSEGTISVYSIHRSA